MKVTPLDIRQKTFERGFRGYEKEEVDAYLQSLSIAWEKMLDELREYKSKNEFLEKELQKMREVESTLYKTLKTAEDTGSSLVEQANKSAELLLKEAQMKADVILNDARYNSKNIIEEAELKARLIEDEAKDHVKIIKRETLEIENLKENLLIELKSIGSELIEKVEKIRAKDNARLQTVIKNAEKVESQLTDLPQSDSFFDNI